MSPATASADPPQSAAIVRLKRLSMMYDQDGFSDIPPKSMSNVFFIGISTSPVIRLNSAMPAVNANNKKSKMISLLELTFCQFRFHNKGIKTLRM